MPHVYLRSEYECRVFPKSSRDGGQFSQSGEQRHSGAGSGGLAAVPSSASPPANCRPRPSHRGEQQTPRERKGAWAGLGPHLPGFHLSHTHHAQPSSPSGFARENKAHTQMITSSGHFLASGDCSVKSFPLSVRPLDSPTILQPARENDHKFSPGADSPPTRRGGIEGSKEAALRSASWGSGGHPLPAQSHLCSNSSAGRPEPAPNPLWLSSAGTRDGPLLDNH